MESVRLSGPPTSARSTPAVLVAERDLQVEDLFAVALEPEMPRLDDAGVDRADRDLVDLLALDAEEVGDADDRRFARLAGPTRRARTVRGVEPDRLEPGMSLGTDPVLLGDLPLEEVGLRAIGGQRREAVRVEGRPADPQESRGRRRRGRRKTSTSPEGSGASPKSAAIRCPAATASTTNSRNSANDSRGIRARGTAWPVAHLQELVIVHRFTSKDAAASRSSDSSGGGM